MGAPIRIDNIAAEHKTVSFIHPDAYAASAGHAALLEMRQQIGRSGPAARWSRLSLTARQMICYAAHLRPSTYASQELDEMTADDREAIRRAIREVREISAAFGEAMLDRRDWMLIPTKPTPGNNVEAQQAEAVKHAKMMQQARAMQSRLNTMQAARPATS